MNVACTAIACLNNVAREDLALLQVRIDEMPRDGVVAHCNCMLLFCRPPLARTCIQLTSFIP